VCQGKLAASITEEQGKTLVDAEGDVMRGLRKKYIISLFCHLKLL
jgi:hypothetical protein